MKYKLLFLVNDLDYFISHRLVIAKKALSEGYKVIVVYGSKKEKFYEELLDLNIKYVYLKIQRGGINPIQEIISIVKVYSLFCKERPDIVHLVTIKPYLYGGIAARFASIPNVVSAIAGLGSLFSSKYISFRVSLYALIPIFKFAFNHPNQTIIVQNLNDKRVLEKKKIITKNNVVLINGSGIKISKFNPNARKDINPTIVMASRLIKEKGIYEFVEAAQQIKIKFRNVKFLLAGEIDEGNPNSISIEKIKHWKKKKIIEVIGYEKNIPKLFSKSHIICFPSYYNEGLPKVLQEAAASGRPVITSINPGCIDAIINNKTGIAVPPKNINALVDAIEYLLDHPEIGEQMGIEGRKLAEKYFDESLIVDQHLKIYKKLIFQR